MTVEEALKLLQRAALYDPTVLPADQSKQIQKAAAWQRTLKDVEIKSAIAAVEAHYTVNTSSIQVADVYRIANREPRVKPFTRCNALLLEKDSEGYYSVWCRRCPHWTYSSKDKLACEAAQNAHNQEARKEGR